MNTHIAKFSVITPQQFKFTKPVETVILGMIPGVDQGLTTYLTELVRTSKPEQQSDTIWFPTLKKRNETEDHIESSHDSWMNWTN